MNKIKYNKLGEYLTSLRKSLGYSQMDVAVAIGVQQQTISHYETGRIIPPSQTMVAFSRLYNVPVEDLMVLTSIGDKKTAEPLNKRSDSNQSMSDMDDYIAYINMPINVSKLRFMGESEKRLLYYYGKLCNRDKHDLIEFLKIRTSSKGNADNDL